MFLKIPFRCLVVKGFRELRTAASVDGAPGRTPYPVNSALGCLLESAYVIIIPAVIDQLT